MNMEIATIICNLTYSILICIIYFSKKRVKSLETNLYGNIIIVNIINLVLEILCYFTVIRIDKLLFITELTNRLFLLTIFLWQLLFTLYIYSISFKSRQEMSLDFKKKKGIIYIIFWIVVSTLILICPLTYGNKAGIIYSNGPGTKLLYLTLIIHFISWIVCYQKRINKDKKSKYIPVLIFMIVILLAILSRTIEPGFLIISSAFSIVTILMYFTIENPDMKMIEKLNVTQAQYNKAASAKSDFLSSMSHEIRTPLNAIVGLCENMSTNKDIPPSLKEDIDDIVTSSHTLLEIVGNIIDINKIDNNELKIINKEYNLVNEINEIFKINKLKLENKDIKYILEFDESIPTTLIGDNIHLKQIINNLLTNSIKYTKKGYIKLSINCINNINKCTLFISVTDTGIGIKKENINKLFTKFERLDVERNTTIEGTGLGLAIVKRLVNLMHGKIKVESIYQKGSTFTVVIPQTIPTKDLSLSTNSINYKNKSILIVDDNKLNIKVAKKALENLNLKQIDECYNGYEALEKVNNKKYDLILMDIMMPVMNGVVTMQTLKQKPNFNTPIIAITADAVEGACEKYIQAGFNNYLAKPFTKRELKEKIDNCLNSKV